MDAINFNQHPIGLNSMSSSNSPQLDKDLNGGCFEADDTWCNSAADAISEAFSNMDEFLATYKESRTTAN